MELIVFLLTFALLLQLVGAQGDGGYNHDPPQPVDEGIYYAVKQVTIFVPYYHGLTYLLIH
jgi:hypothetical protein